MQDPPLPPQLLLLHVILKTNLLLLPQYQAQCMMQMFYNHSLFNKPIYVYVVVYFLYISGKFCFSFVFGYGNVANEVEK